jgi:hypothetical protein
MNTVRKVEANWPEHVEKPEEGVGAFELLKHLRSEFEGQAASELELTILMPCLNEAETLATCIRKARDYLDRAGIKGEVLIADNGSTDGSQQIAKEEGARVQPVSARGYGAALIGGIRAARGKYIIMGDADDSYDFSSLDAFVWELREGAQLVMGNRFQGGIAPGAMPFLHRMLGNPVLSFIGRLFFKIPVGDFHCGLRGFNRDAIRDLTLSTSAKCRPRCLRTAGRAPLTCAPGATAGAIFAFSCCTARNGCSVFRDPPFSAQASSASPPWSADHWRSQVSGSTC